MDIVTASDKRVWDDFLTSQKFSPFLQSFTMGEVYADIDQTPVRLLIKDNDAVVGICFGHKVPAKRGVHLSIPYGPVLADMSEEKKKEALTVLIEELKKQARALGCSFIRISPFWPEGSK